MKQIEPQYSGEISWHTDNPPVEGIYLATLINGDIDIVRYYKKNKTFVYRTTWYMDESECYFETTNIRAWAYLPYPYDV